MAKSFKVIGLIEAINTLDKMGNDYREICGKGIYDGAGFVADTLKDQISKLPRREDNDPNRHPRGATDTEVSGLLSSMGIAPMRDNGDSLDVQVGFDGYNNDVTEKYPKGKPNAMVARALESGTSWLSKTPFIGPAERASRAKAEAIMEKTIQYEIQKRG